LELLELSLVSGLIFLKCSKAKPNLYLPILSVSQRLRVKMQGFFPAFFLIYRHLPDIIHFNGFLLFFRGDHLWLKKSSRPHFRGLKIS
jgi:hypothetical protein